MKIKIYYGGRGVIDDPSLYVISRMGEVFRELDVQVEQFNLYEQKNSITALINTLKDADGIILASTVEWFGVGGYMMQFLDACWLYADKEKLSRLYMLPVVMSTTYGERDGMTLLSNAWEILGGMPCDGICGYVAETTILESTPQYKELIEKKAENMYRAINQKLPGLPNSNQAVKKRISFTKGLELTPQESEQLSQYASDDQYVRKQKEDIQELAGLFRSRMGKETKGDDASEFAARFKSHFHPVEGVRARYKVSVTDRPSLGCILLNVQGEGLNAAPCAESEPCDVSVQLPFEVLNNIMGSRMTFQRAFMEGSMKAKGEFKLLRSMDMLFNFMEPGQ